MTSTAPVPARDPAAVVEPDPHFVEQDGDLSIDGVSLTAIVAAVGTPLFVYSAAAVRERARAYRGLAPDLDLAVRYAVKANPLRALLELVRDEGIGADVVSGGEMRAALAAGIAPADVVFAGVGKTPDEIRDAFERGIGHLSVESPWEIDHIAAHRPPASPTRLLVRTNVDVDGSTHPYLTTGRSENKFGIDADTVRARYRGWQDQGLPVDGVHVHIGSQILDPAGFHDAARAAIALVEGLRSDGGHVSVVDFGGGVGVPYEAASRALDLTAYGAAVRAVAESLGVRVLLEPGRSIVAEPGIAVGRVLHQKAGRVKDFLVTDLAMNDLIRPALYGAWHAVQTVASGPRPPSPRPVDVVGPVCESGDFVARDRRLPVLEHGDLVVVRTAGAYGSAMASNYTLRPRPAEVLVDGGGFRVVRPRQRLDDLIG